jgi:prolyl oligopeptidase
LFQLAVLEPDAEHAVVVVRTALSAEPRVLVDPNALTAKRGTPVSLSWFVPSPDGRTLAYAVMAAGTEVFEVGLIDVETGEALPDEISWSVAGPVSWLPDSLGFWCSGREFTDGAFRMLVYRYELGTTPSPPVELPEGLMDPRPNVSADGRYVALATGNTEQRLDWILRDGAFQPLLRDVPGSAAGVFVGDDLFALVDDGAPRGRLARIPVATAGDLATWVELVPETEDVLRQVEVVGDTIVLGYLRDAACGIRLLGLDGAPRGEVELPGAGNASIYVVGASSHPALPMFECGDGEISFVFSTPDASPAVYRCLVADQRLELVTPPAVQLDGLTITTITTTSRDGTQVPAHIVHRTDLDTSVPQPTVIYGYGGFNVAWLPAYLPAQSAWVEAGGVFVLPHLRGGSDFGAEWWRQGTRERKQNTFDDLFAIAQHLIDTGLTTSRQLAVKGESNGGLLAGAAIVQRPDLWAAVVADVPILDLLGMERDPLTYAIGRVEYGDPRCPAWHSRVFVDRVERAQSGDAPILVRVYEDQGHGVAGLTATSGKEADWLAFVAAATGLEL